MEAPPERLTSRARERNRIDQGKQATEDLEVAAHRCRRQGQQRGYVHQRAISRGSVLDAAEQVVCLVNDHEGELVEVPVLVKLFVGEDDQSLISQGWA